MAKKSVTPKMPLQTRRPATPPRVFPPRRDYASLSIKDLLDAREAYHVYLSSLDNVLATAIGRYYIHEKDWYATHPPDVARPDGVGRVAEARTLLNSVIRPWSWPAVVVFVKQWESMEALGPNAVPRTLYLPDGRVLPTCVVEATPDVLPLPPATGPAHVSEMVGGGYACVREHQGESSQGTFACLVKKGGSYYALTNRHVAGGDGEVVRSYIRGEYRRVGQTSTLAADRQPMTAIFPAWAGNRVLLTLDAGLVRIDNVGDWTSQAYGIGEIGEVFDATEASVTLDLVGLPVCAFGGTSGASRGVIRALFYRFDSVGGFDYVTDVLIGPRTRHDPADAVPADGNGKRGGAAKEPPPLTRPGDSGTLWFYDPPVEAPNPHDLEHSHAPADRGRRAQRLRPVAMQWGGSRIGGDGGRATYALGTFVSSIARVLDVEIIRDWNIGHEEYWGKIGHFSIGFKACDRLAGKLSTLMRANQDLIGVDSATLAEDGFKVDRDKFVPLADVPDYKWIGNPGRAFENIQHFADIDIQGIDGSDPLIDRCLADPNNVAASVWKSFFDGFADAGVGPDPGALPFRVWQLWELMVDSLKTKDVIHFVAAGGVMAHYVGDASQPLHCSYLHHGVPPMVEVGGREYPVRHGSPDWNAFAKTREYKIHGIYEEQMLEVDPAQAMQDVDDVLAARNPLKLNITRGHQAAVAMIRLMDDARKRLTPQQIIDLDDPSLTQPQRARRLWETPKVRTATARCIADSVDALAALWTSAWKAGNGDTLAAGKLTALDPDDLVEVYRKSKFAQSFSLDEMAAGGDFEP